MYVANVCRDDLIFVCLRLYRAAGKPIGFTECVRLHKITSLAQDRLAVKLKEFNLAKDDECDDEPMDDNTDEESESCFQLQCVIFLVRQAVFSIFASLLAC